ncbi:hypothetical protein HAZT_HAZT003648 [Hyalella azteca]|uniref:Uncharacterized protein n=1 Tax=Hyalella azteca TaxID=294128 RepID=A0A6A0GRF2_HYAAZ|nr:hypothetical protein HAZT_HAZT003648 [Hyalella azteca]
MPNKPVYKLDDSFSREYDVATQKALEDIDICQNEIDQLIEKANEEEEECLHHLTKLDVEEFDDIKSGYRINFYFDTNPYFSNDVLTKEFHLGSSGDPTSQSTTINWKEGHNLLSKFEEQLQKNGGSSASSSRGKKRPLETRSFFRWFTDHGDPSSDDIAEQVPVIIVNQLLATRRPQHLLTCSCAAQVIKDDIWPNPLHYFLVPDIEVENGDEEEDDGEDGEDEEEGIEEDDDEEEEEEEDDDEEENARAAEQDDAGGEKEDEGDANEANSKT